MVFLWVISFGALVMLALARRALAKSFTGSPAVYIPRSKAPGEYARSHDRGRAHSRGCTWSNIGDVR
jgi:hypothetical protein